MVAQVDVPSDHGSAPAPWYAVSPDDLVAALGADQAAGLSSARAAELLVSNGPNELPEEGTRPSWLRFLDEYRSFMQIILVGAATVSLLIQEWGTALLLVLLTVLNAVVGIRQQGKAESAMNALKSMLKTRARVQRDGVVKEIDATDVVVGDVVLLTAGDQVPADGRIVSASALQIDESALTGESVPASKDADTLPADPLGAGDQTNMAFMNTPVTHGSGTVIVTGTGAGTELGKISEMLSGTVAEQSPLTKELNKLSVWIASAAGLTMIVMFVTGRGRGVAWDVLFVSAVSLAIAAIPEALPTVTQVILSMGSVELAKRNAIVKDLPSVETLGFTSAINSDKTGTLTMNQMTAVEVVDPTDRYTITGIGYGLEGHVQHAAGSSDTIEAAILPYLVASDAELVDGKVVGDPTEGALLVLGAKAGVDVAATREKLPRLATLPFDPTYKLMATFHSAVDAKGRPVVRCFVKGAAPAVMARAGTALSNGVTIPWSPELSERALASMERMEGDGRRVMAAAVRDLDPADFMPTSDLLAYVSDLQMTSLVGMVDPPREESKAAVHDAQAAHIRVRMVTGDDVTTGAAIAKQLGIEGEAILGADFAAMTEAERLSRIDDIGVVGRVAPEHKVLLADTLKKKGEVVAMTGDGVNDAPALKEADIGIAMGITGTEVSKEAAVMILTDDNFATIVKAVELGRGLYDNLTRYIRFQIGALAGFIITFLGASILNIVGGVPFLPLQTLWVNFTTQVFQSIGLGYSKFSEGLMDKKPRAIDEPILDRNLIRWLAVVGLVHGAVVLGILQWASDHRTEEIARTMAVTSFGLMNLFYSFTVISDVRSVFSLDTFSDRRFVFVSIASFVAILIGAQMDVMNRLLDTRPLDRDEWLICIASSLSIIVVSEIRKLLLRRKQQAVGTG
jgi:Ca2+-transporting ATPase